MLDKIYEFNPVIYPIRLWVSMTQDEELLNKKFEYVYRKQPIVIHDNYYAITYDVFRKKTTHEAGILILFNEDGMTMKYITHEAFHVIDGILEYIGEENPGDEQKAYLGGWVAQCCEVVVKDYLKYLDKNK